MNRINKRGVTTTAAPGQEQHETFTRRTAGKTKRYVQYDYRHTDGRLFTCVSATLEQCRAKRDCWMNKKQQAV